MRVKSHSTHRSAKHFLKKKRATLSHSKAQTAFKNTPSSTYDKSTKNSSYTESFSNESEVKIVLNHQSLLSIAQNFVILTGSRRYIYVLATAESFLLHILLFACILLACLVFLKRKLQQGISQRQLQSSSKD